MATNNRTTRTMTATEARQQFAKIINQVVRHEADIIVEKNGVPVAVIVSMTAYRELKNLREERAERFKVLNEVRAAFADVPEDELMREAQKALDEVRAEMRAEREQARAKQE